MQKVPAEKENNNFLVPEDVMTYYKIDDNCNFQTLFLDAYGKTTKIPSAIVGRFTGERLSKTTYTIKKLETKAFKVAAVNATYPNEIKGYKVVNVELHEESKESNIIFIITIEGTADHNQKKTKVDYIYGNKEGEDSIILKTDAKITFHVKEKTTGNSGSSKPTGGYECDGVAIVSGG